MTGIAAAIARTNLDVSPIVTTMLGKLSHRGGNSFGLACPGLVQECASTDDLDSTHSTSVLGAVNRKSVFDDLGQPIEDKECYIVLDGRLYDSGSLPDIVYTAEVVRGHPKPNLGNMVRQERGAYAAAVLSTSQILLGRDSIGTIPVYIGETRDFCAAATEKKALWEVGVRSVRPLAPGHVVELSNSGVTAVPVSPLKLPPTSDFSSGELIRMLEQVSHEIFEFVFRKAEQIAVGYSGGLDSSLAAYFADESGVDVELISVGLDDSRDLAYSQGAAEAMGLPYAVETYSQDDVEGTLDEAIYLAESPDPLQIQIAVPILWAAKAASERGHRWLVLGQGCDELFGGYYKYQNRFLAAGGHSARELMFTDLVSGSERDFVRDNKVVSSQGIELALPFLSQSFVELALSIPVGYKLGKGIASERKIILRELGNLIGLPTEVTHRKKDAIQYSTGVSQALRRLARRKGLTLSQLIHQRFHDVFGSMMQIPE